MNAILTRDLLMNFMLGLVALVILVLPQINPPAATTPDIPPPGNIAVLACWPEGPIDVDLWTQGPGQQVATGYSNKSGRVWSLLRDDMGVVLDDSPINCESAFARVTPAGEYVINAHCYSCSGVTPVHIEASLNGALLLSRDMTLAPKQERTAIAFRLDAAGNVVSHDSVYRPLRSNKK